MVSEFGIFLHFLDFEVGNPFGPNLVTFFRPVNGNIVSSGVTIGVVI